MKRNEKMIWVGGVIALLLFVIGSFLIGLPFPELSKIRENPQVYEGLRVEYYGLAENISEKSFILTIGDQSILVYEENPRETVFGYTSVSGILQRDGSLVADEVWYHDQSWWLFVPSILGLVFFLILFFYEWRIKGWRFVRA